MDQPKDCICEKDKHLCSGFSKGSVCRTWAWQKSWPTVRALQKLWKANGK